MFCTKCGNSLKEGDKFCENCGTPVFVPKSWNPVPPAAPRYSTQPVTKPAPLSKKTKIMNIAFIVVGIAIVLCGYFFIVYRSTKLIVEPMQTLIEKEIDEYFEEAYEDSYDEYDYDDYEWSDDEEEEVTEEDPIEYVHVDAPEYKGEYNYYKNDKWFISIENLIINSEGKTSDKLLGENASISTSRDFTEGMALTEGGQFYYINSDTAVVEFAPGTKCAELALDGDYMFYVIPEKTMGKGDEIEVGTLYIFNTATGISQKLAADVDIMSPVISADGKTVAYTRFTDSKNMALFIGGPEMEEKKLEKGQLRACSVTNEGNLFYTNKDQTEIYRYKDGKSKKVLTCSEFNNYFVDGDLDEILISCADGAYYCDSEMEKAACVFEGSLVTNMHTNGIHQSYGQFWATILDVKSLRDLFFISKTGKVFIINESGEGAAVLDHDYDDLGNIVFDDAGRMLLYSYDGVLYKSEVKDEGIEDTVLYDDEYIDTFFAGYDLKNIWIKVKDDIYYLKGDELSLVIPDYEINKDAEGLLFAWNIEDNKLYFTENGNLYSVYDTESSTERVSEDCAILAKYYGKLAYADYEDAVYVYINGEFVKVYD